MVCVGSLGGATLPAAGDVNLPLAKAQDGVLALFTRIDWAACAEERTVPAAGAVEGGFQVLTTGGHRGGLALRTGEGCGGATIRGCHREFGQRQVFARGLGAADGRLDVPHAMSGRLTRLVNTSTWMAVTADLVRRISTVFASG